MPRALRHRYRIAIPSFFRAPSHSVRTNNRGKLAADPPLIQKNPQKFLFYPVANRHLVCCSFTGLMKR